MWTSSTTKEQLLNKIDPKVDFRMSMIKPHLCAWLFYAWTQFNERKTMICKGWEKTCLLQSFNLDFQMEALRVNMTKALFSSNLTQEIEICDPIHPDDNDLDIEEDT
jgi:hypothetical protein